MQFSELIIKLGSAVTASSLGINKDLDPILTGLAPIETASSEMMSYIEGDKFAKFVSTTGASALVLPMNEAIQAVATERGIAWIAAKEPRLLFAQVIKQFYQPFRLPVGIHPSAIVETGVELGEGVSIGAHATIQSGVKIGNGAIVHPNVVIYPDVEIGDRSIIHSGAVIGADGFGFVPMNGEWKKFPFPGDGKSGMD